MHIEIIVSTFCPLRVTIHDIRLVPGQMNVVKEVLPARLDVSLVADTGNTPTHLNRAIVDGLQASDYLTPTGATIAI